jgi:hypothetical protein
MELTDQLVRLSAYNIVLYSQVTDLENLHPNGDFTSIQWDMSSGMYTVNTLKLLFCLILTITVWNPFVILKMDGCAFQCCINIHQVTVVDLMRYHNYFMEISRNLKYKWLLDYFNTHTSEMANGDLDITFLVCGKQVNIFNALLCI